MPLRLWASRSTVSRGADFPAKSVRVGAPGVETPGQSCVNRRQSTRGPVAPWKTGKSTAPVGLGGVAGQRRWAGPLSPSPRLPIAGLLLSVKHSPAMTVNRARRRNSLAAQSISVCVVSLGPRAGILHVRQGSDCGNWVAARRGSASATGRPAACSSRPWPKESRRQGSHCPDHDCRRPQGVRELDSTYAEPERLGGRAVARRGRRPKTAST